MSDYPSITESPLRDRAVVDAVRQCIANGKPPSFGFVSEIVSSLFDDLGDDELEIAVAWVNSEMVRNRQDGQVPSVEVQPSEPDTADLRNEWGPNNVSEPVEHVEAEPVEETAPTREQINDEIAATAREMQMLQGDKLTAEQVYRDCRDRLSQAIFSYQTHGERKTKYSREQLVRDTIRANQAYKQAVIDGTIEPPPRPKTAQGSYRDRVGAWRGDASDFVRRYQGVHTPLAPGVQVQKGDSRGAYPKSALGRVVRLPSEG